MEIEYPRWKHHPKHGGKLVHSEDEAKTLGKEWGDDSSVWRPHLIRKDPAPEVKVDAVLESVEKAEEIVEQVKAKPGRPKRAT
jgi:hypothetical protein